MEKRQDDGVLGENGEIICVKHKGVNAKNDKSKLRRLLILVASLEIVLSAASEDKIKINNADNNIYAARTRREAAANAEFFRKLQKL